MKFAGLCEYSRLLIIVVPRLVRGIQKIFDVALDPANKSRDDGNKLH